MMKRLAVIALSMLLATPALADDQADVLQPLEAKNGGLNMVLSGIHINLGGYLEGASIYRSRNLNTDVSSTFNNVPLQTSPGYYQNETTFSARQSRLSLLALGNVDPATHLGGYYEMDFQGVSNTSNSKQKNSYAPGIRHLYASADWDNLGLHILAGQTWSLTDLNSRGITPRNEITPLVIDSQGNVGYTNVRQPQVRIVKDLFDKKLWLAASAELADTTTSGSTPSNTTNYDATVTAPTSGNLAGDTYITVNAIPDFILKAALEPGWGHFEVYDLIRTFESGVHSTTANGSPLVNVHTTTNAVGAGAILPLVPKYLALTLSGLAGDGVGRYGAAQLPDTTYNNQGGLTPLRGFQYLIGLSFAPTDAVDIYSYLGQEHVNGTLQYGGNQTGSSNAKLSFLGTTYGGSVVRVSEITGGTWWKVYNGNYGKMQLGLQYSYLEDKYSQGVGGTPIATDNMVFTSLRYYWQ
jgi:hypothetical protein